MATSDYGFVCECGGEVAEIWEQISVRGGQGAYRCTECGETGRWVCGVFDDAKSGLTGCLVRREAV